MDTSQLIPENIQKLQAYTPGKTIEEVIKAHNPKRISKLASNENRLGSSPKAVEKAQESFETINNYPDSASLDLKNKLAEWHGVQPERIIVGAGSESLIAMITRAFFSEGETALTASATFVGFFVSCRIKGIQLKQVGMSENYGFDLEKIAEALTDEVKLVYLANPNNPTGTYFTKSELDSFLDKVPSNVLVVLDEAYYEFAKDYASDYPNGLTYDHPNIIVLRTFSKAYGLAGFRVGYGIAAPDLITAMSKTKLVFEPSAPAQYAAMGALEDHDFLEETCKMTHLGRVRIYETLGNFNIPFAESYANSVMAVFDDEQEAEYFTNEMLKRGVILRRLPGFGLPNCVRITVGVQEEMDHFEAALEEVYNKKSDLKE